MARVDKITQQTQPDELYSDFLTDFNPHPVSGQLLRVINEPAVTRSIRNLILTNNGERLYQPSIGSGVRKLLFEHINAATTDLLSQMIQQTIDEHEPRAKVLAVNVIPYYDQHKYVVTIKYMIINNTTPISIELTLTRVR